MKILLGSDLHLEFKSQLALPPLPEYDIAVLAGDIHMGTSGIGWAMDKMDPNKPVLYVPGNHEYYRQDYLELQRMFDRTWDNIHVLNPGIFEFQGWRFTGATLWGPLVLEGYREYSPEQYEKAISDFMVINVGDQKLTGPMMQLVNAHDANFIEESLAESKLKNIVITHFLPSQECIVPFYVGNALNPYFCNDLDYIMLEYEPELWLFGHTHTRMDRVHSSGTRMICNPKGYPKENEKKYSWKVIEL